MFSNRRLGPSVELLLAPDVASAMLRDTALAVRETAAARWEHELGRWLETLAARISHVDVGDLAWTPEHFDAQRCFLVDAIDRAIATSAHEAILRRWKVMVAQHPRDSVQFGRRWPQVAVTA